ncbi:MAG: type II toxin-antitoxin system HicB family antitoxin [Gallionella sp.]|nr:type II toxin-antitoxin system HicB family antitoxin [Gallionella sp.]
MQLTAVLTQAQEGGFIALNPETGTTTQGETISEALHNLQEATALYLDEFPLISLGHPLVTTFDIPAHA